MSSQDARPWTIAGFALVSLIGIAHLFIIGTRVDRRWMKYSLHGIDALTMCSLSALIPVSPAEPIPQIITFRAYGIHHFFPLLVLASLCLSWKLVLWTGVMIVVGWLAAFYSVISGMQDTLSWSDIPANATRLDYEITFLSINFIGAGNRIKETGLLVASAGVLAIVVYRARRVFFAQINSDAMHQHERGERPRVTATFRQYVPEVVLDQLVESGGKIPPQQSHGIVLSLDIDGFTAFSADKSPDTIIRKLDDFLSDTADQISLNQGVFISYLGDGLLASINAPLKIDDAERFAA